MSLEPPTITVALTVPIATSFALRPVSADADAQSMMRGSIARYLMTLDGWRESGMPDRAQLSVPGRFGDVVAAGIAATATPGVKRKFELGALRVERFLVKPWGTPAIAEVTATIVDKAVDGGAPDQVEAGRLRLLGDRLFVSDAWDYSAGRWFNGIEKASPSAIRENVAQPIGWLLRSESWVPGSALETNFGASGETPYLKARHDYLNELDRTATPSRTFADVTATIEKYETFPEISHGLATVRIKATVLTTDASGTTTRQPVERRAVILFGNWGPEVVDEEIAPGKWLSGGDLALQVRDHNFA